VNVVSNAGDALEVCWNFTVINVPPNWDFRLHIFQIHLEEKVWFESLEETFINDRDSLKSRDIIPKKVIFKSMHSVTKTRRNQHMSFKNTDSSFIEVIMIAEINDQDF